MITQVMGFDIRVIDTRVFDQTWDRARRQHYLLRRDVTLVASVDIVAFPSVFQFGDPRHLQKDDEKVVIQPRDRHQRVFRLWHNVNAMEQAASVTYPPQRLDAVSIAITAVNDEMYRFPRW